MKIAFVGCKETKVSIFKELAKALSKRISGLELSERFVPDVMDLPFVASECTKESDFVFVFAFAESEEQAAYVRDKLIEVELATETRILKAVTDDEMSGTDEDSYLEAKDALVKKYADLIVNILFNESEFESEDRDFSI